MNGRVVQYTGPKGQTINLIHNGEAPNLMTGIGVDDTTIFLPNLEHALIAQAIHRGNQIDHDFINQSRSSIQHAHLEAMRELQLKLERGVSS